MGVRVLAAVARRSVLMGVAGLTLVLASCGGAHDSAGGLTKEDYEALKARRPAPDVRTLEEPPIPDLQPILAAPQPPSLADSRRVSVQATEPTSVRDLLIEIARRADIDLELDPRIEGGVIITARDRPVADVIDRLADLAGLRYEFKDNRLRVELDEPYLDSYRVDALSLRRTTASSISSSTDVFSAVGEGGGSGNASSTAVTTEAEADLWQEITDNINAMINQIPARPRLAQTAATTVPATAEPADVTAGAAPDGRAGQPAQGAIDPLAAAQQIAATQGADPAQPPATASSGGGSADQASSVGSSVEGNGHYFAVNRQAGIVSVFTTSNNHRKIASYLKEVQDRTQAQILIEAKIVEVNLQDQFRAGIDWQLAFNVGNFALGGSSLLSQRGLREGGGLSLPDGLSPIGTLGASASAGSLDFDSVLDFVEIFGTTRTLSNPRLTVLNNQNAVLKVAENDVYFVIRSERERVEDGPDVVTFTSEIRTVPVGVVMSVQPNANYDSQEIMMNLRPTISRIVKRVSDPAVELQASIFNTEVRSEIPVVEVREMDSMVKIRNGDVLILGGLMQERAASSETGTPGVKDVPVLGLPFRRESRNTEVVELVIFLRATIVNGRDSVHPADVELYNKFTPDPRPIAF